MAHHKSALKRIRQSNKKRIHNKYYAKTTRNAIKKLRSLTSKTEGIELLPKVTSMLDGLVKRNIIHKNKARNLRGKLTKFVSQL